MKYAWLLSVVVATGCLSSELDPARSEGDQGNAGAQRAGHGERRLKVDGSQAAAVCHGEDVVVGIDVSRFQETIDWDAVAGDTIDGKPIAYAFIQVSRSVADIGQTPGIDPRFEENWAGAKAAGLLRGAYQRFRPEEDIEAQADIMIDKLMTNGIGELPPVLDVEDTGGKSPAEIGAAIAQWMAKVEPMVGVVPIIYTRASFWDVSVDGPALARHPLWVAHYIQEPLCPNIPDDWSTWQFHQWTQDGMLDGITENTVDLNWFNGTLAELQTYGAPCGTLPAAGGVIDDTDDCFVGGGNPDSLRHETAGFGSSLTWTYTTDDTRESNFGAWLLHFAETGRYQLEVYTEAPWSQSTMARYRVSSGGQTQAVVIDQTANDGWQSLGEFDFAAGGGHQVRLGDNSGEPLDTDTQIVFDALRITRVGAPPTPDGGPIAGDAGIGPMPDESGGCGCSSVAGETRWSNALLLLLALLWWGRRHPQRH